MEKLSSLTHRFEKWQVYWGIHIQFGENLEAVWGNKKSAGESGHK